MKRGGPLRRGKPLRSKTQLRSNTELPRGGRLPAQSPKRRAESPERRAVLDAARKRAGYRCEAEHLVPVPCGFLPGRTVLEGHERIPRSVWPGGHLVLDNVIMVCPAQHDWITDHPADAHRLGLYGYSWEVPQ